MILREEGNDIRGLAPAKLNLVLAVYGKREDGYHEIETLMTPVDLFDEIVVSRRLSGIMLECDVDWVPSGEENLVHRAAARAMRRFGLPGGVAIRLVKRIPAGAGLGGGSSDAATTLAAVARLHGLHPAPGDLHEEAAALGSDVPFFLYGTSAVCRGRGEQVAPIGGLPVRHYVLVVPDLHVSTKAVYEALESSLTPGTSPRKIVPGFLMGEDGRLAERDCFNGLEDAAFRRFPELRTVKFEMERRTGRDATMTGSGSGFFVIATTRREAEDLRSRLEGWIGRGRAYALTTAHARGERLKEKPRGNYRSAGEADGEP